MEYKEFANVEGRDYDLYSNDGSIAVNNKFNPYSDELTYLIGILEEEEIQELPIKYGITKEEYFNPTEETVNKVKEALGIGMHRKI